MSTWQWLILSHTFIGAASFLLGAWAMRSHIQELARRYEREGP